MLSQNIKQGAKGITINKRIKEINNSQRNLHRDNFKNFKSFVKSSTSAVDLYSKPTLIKKTNDSEFQGPRFLDAYDKIKLKDIKTYKDIQQERHLGPLEINYQYNMPDYYDKNSRNEVSTAPQLIKRKKRASSLNKQDQNSNSQRLAIAKTSHGRRNCVDNLTIHKNSNFRSGTTATYEMTTFSPTNQSIFRVTILDED